MRFYRIDPIADPRWTKLVERHPNASVFHTVGWLEALRRTHGYESTVFTTSPPDRDLDNGWVFSCVNSWLTGRRLVSLPFSDHCEPLCDAPENVTALISNLESELKRQEWKYIELRPILPNSTLERSSDQVSFRPASTYFLHRLDLHPELEIIFRSLNKASVQRRVRHAQKAGLVEKTGRSEELLRDFYRLFVATRQRHRLPPIPCDWFENLIECQGQALEIRAAYQNDTPVAAIVTLKFKNIVYYKYGASDARFNKFGAMPWLLWNAITTAKAAGATQFDMGRTEPNNVGLLTFKNHWVALPEKLIYWKFPDTKSLDSVDGWRMKAAKRLFSLMPTGLLTLTGRLIYRHIG
jgi:hypothetical protein